MKFIKNIFNGSDSKIDTPPNNVTDQVDQDKMTLDKLKPGESATVIYVEPKRNISNRICEMGFTEGTKVTMIRRAPLEDPIEFNMRGYLISMRKEEAALVYVSQIDE